MKAINSIQKSTRAFGLLILATLSSLYTFAQDVPEKVDVDINTNGGGAVWYGQPWVWAIGVAIFILVLVIVTRNNKGSNA